VKKNIFMLLLLQGYESLLTTGGDELARSFPGDSAWNKFLTCRMTLLQGSSEAAQRSKGFDNAE
jgi:hypothetical protein